MPPRRIEFFKTQSGRCPVEDYILEIKYRKERARIAKALEAVQAASILPQSIFKKMAGRDSLWEVRIDRHRFLCFFDGAELLILAVAFLKKTQKTPQQEIELAIARLREYQFRKGNAP